MLNRLKNLYGGFRNKMPLPVKGFFTHSLYALHVKPTINSKRKNKLKKGVVVFSADFEMAWAFRFSKTIHEPEKYGMQERKNFPLLLKLFDQYHIPVTWATVGHLFLDECSKKENEIAHPDLPRPGYFENRNWRFDQGDWYQHDPCTNVKDAPAWYAPDLIDLILKSKVAHEIACHTFSHSDFTDQHCSAQFADAEIAACKTLAEKIGIELKSFVFPGGTLGNYEALKKNGFLCYRKPMTYDIDLPQIDKYGMVAIPSSIGLDKTPYSSSPATYIRHINKFLNLAAKHRQVCHFWFHPSMDPWYLKEILPGILENITKAQGQGSLEILTMHELALKILKEA